MNKSTSIYLDLIRFMAAAMVLLIHANSPRFTDGWLYSLRNAGNDTVMLFFVLSGFVIAYCADTRDNNLPRYALSRFSRLYSVVLPALLVMLLLNFLGRALDLHFYDGTPWHYTSTEAYEFFISLFFSNQLWLYNLVPFSNGPFWSVAYEFWFYVLFAAWYFVRGRLRVPLVIVLLAIVGPKILLLFPIWLMGYFGYQIVRKATISPTLGFCLFVGSIVLYAIFVALQIEKILTWYTFKLVGPEVFENSLGPSKWFVSSFIVGLLATANFVGFSAMSTWLEPRLSRMQGFGVAIQYAASFTFTLYLLHYPLLDFWAAFAKLDPKQGLDQASLFALVLASVWVIGCISERQKSRFKALLARGARLFQGTSPLDLQH